MSRRKARVLAFQALHSYDVGGQNLEDLLKLDWVNSSKGEEPAEEEGAADNAPLDSETSDFARILIAGTINHLPEIDDMIRKHLSANWDFSRLNRVNLAVLRMSVYSLLFQTDLSPLVVIDEAIAIVKRYGDDKAFRFVNAILDNIRKEVEQDKGAENPVSGE